MKTNRTNKLSTKKRKVSYNLELEKASNPKVPKDRYIQVKWVNTQGAECKRIIEPNRCFCTHSFEYHENSKTIGSAFCLSPGCSCKCYQYVPYYDIKCMCRHSYKEHDRNSKMCKMCNKCLGFVTNWSCKCGFRYDQHETVFEIAKHKIISERAQDRFLEKNKENLQSEELASKELFKSHVVDARTIEMSKYDLNLNVHTKSEQKVDEHKLKQIQRINEKYSQICFEKQVDKSKAELIEGNLILKPEGARMVTPLELYIRPHNYVPVKLEKFLESEYRKHNNL